MPLSLAEFQAELDKGGKVRNNKLYTIVSGTAWTTAEANAVSLGGHLVSINSQEEQDFIKQNFIDNDLSNDVGKWIGLTDKDIESNWTWTDGTDITFTNWQPGKPNDNRTDETSIYSADYGLITTPSTPWNSEHGSWNDFVNDPAINNQSVSGIVEINLDDIYPTVDDELPIEGDLLIDEASELGNYGFDTYKLLKSEIYINKFKNRK